MLMGLETAHLYFWVYFEYRAETERDFTVYLYPFSIQSGADRAALARISSPRLLSDCPELSLLTFHFSLTPSRALHANSEEPCIRSSVRDLRRVLRLPRSKEDVATQLDTQRAVAAKKERAEVKLVTGAQLSDAGS